MSDTGRKSMTEQAGEKMKPDTQKSTTEKMGDTASGMYDRVADTTQPETQKSTAQQMGDKARGTTEEGSKQAKGMTESMQGMASSAAQTVKDTMHSMTGNK